MKRCHTHELFVSARPRCSSWVALLVVSERRSGRSWPTRPRPRTVSRITARDAVPCVAQQGSCCRRPTRICSAWSSRADLAGAGSDAAPNLQDARAAKKAAGNAGQRDGQGRRSLCRGHGANAAGSAGLERCRQDRVPHDVRPVEEKSPLTSTTRLRSPGRAPKSRPSASSTSSRLNRSSPTPRLREFPDPIQLIREGLEEGGSPGRAECRDGLQQAHGGSRLARLVESRGQGDEARGTSVGLPRSKARPTAGRHSRR